MRDPAQAVALVRAFDVSREEEKSRELILALLELTPAPFSRDQFHPGHITCTALVLHPNQREFLVMHHHRHRRWLLPQRQPRRLKRLRPAKHLRMRKRKL